MSKKTPGKRGPDPSGKKGQWNDGIKHQTILRIPNPVYEAIKAHADENYRTVNAEVVMILVKAIQEFKQS